MFGINLWDLILLLRLLRNLATSTSPLVVLLRGPLMTVLLSASLILAVMSGREGGLWPAIQALLTKPRAAEAMQQ